MHTTYNMVNAAFNFCEPNDTQLLVDGDDEIIGKTAFSILSSIYGRSRAFGR